MKIKYTMAFMLWLAVQCWHYTDILPDYNDIQGWTAFSKAIQFLNKQDYVDRCSVKIIQQQDDHVVHLIWYGTDKPVMVKTSP